MSKWRVISLGLGILPVLGVAQSFETVIYTTYTEGIGASSTRPGSGFGNRSVPGGSELDVYLFGSGESQSMTSAAPSLAACKFSSGMARKSNGTVEQIVGYGQLAGGKQHAIALGYAIDVVSGRFLDDGGASMSRALGTDGTAIVGSRNSTDFAPPEAVYWDHPDASPVRLTAVGVPAEAYGVDADFITGNWAPSLSQRAVVWNRTNFDAFDLNPAGFQSSSLYGISDATGLSQTVGWGFNALWVATGFISAYDGANWTTEVLTTPSGFSETYLYDTDGTNQVGSARSNSNNRQQALLWTGAGSTPVDLHGYTTGLLSSEARHIDEFGNVFGFGLTTGFNRVGIAWMRESVPEPSCMLALATGLAIGLLRRRPAT